MESPQRAAFFLLRCGQQTRGWEAGASQGDLAWKEVANDGDGAWVCVRVRKGSTEPAAALDGVGGAWWGGVRPQVGGTLGRTGMGGQRRVLFGHAHFCSL